MEMIKELRTRRDKNINDMTILSRDQGKWNENEKAKAMLGNSKI